MSFEDTLRTVIPSEIKIFAKLTEGHDPYYFFEWDKIDNSVVLRYWFWNKTKTGKHKKRVFIEEIPKLLSGFDKPTIITRTDFEKNCPRTKSDGGCGFAVMIRILEHFQIVESVDGKYLIKRTEKIRELVD
jgi:hypothetical protein